MRKANGILLIAIIMFFIQCDKSESSYESIKRIHCNNLITDTAGVNDSGRVYMPTAFTPDGNGINDAFVPIFVNISSIDFKIYDSLNNIIFSTTQIGEAWAFAPKPLSNTKYFYRIQAITTSNHKIGVCGEFHSLKCIPSGMALTSYLFPDQLSLKGIIYPTNELISNCP